jgi:hypothetical protein
MVMMFSRHLFGPDRLGHKNVNGWTLRANHIVRGAVQLNTLIRGNSIDFNMLVDVQSIFGIGMSIAA